MQPTRETDNSLEEARIEALRKYEILDTPPDGSFDHITRLAARLLNVPIAIVSLVDTDRIWFKSRYGVEVQEIGREPGLCASAILTDDFYLVEDAKKDVRTLANPLVASEFGLQFYAAAPLKTRDGFNLGTLCIIDKKPRKLSFQDQKTLTDLAELVIQQMELRLEARIAVKHQHQILNITAHDLKNPLSIMPLLADLIIHNKENPAAIDDIAQQIKNA
ncbi:GAF domain-containing protein [Antarcticibacterium sp. 1MA-6-2]|uniref:GAF domain-containing protein n=1 Tax=Antarcticibacterium sp. 1MA-6-2 TaxID=2908210 RepID=UPI001F3E6136|nr:GAF domain-containing protein [Antarcticibacterium sp. 1MA-6-2]UJH90844.1 GAF domain-containing protein [Antarcticibacterium sp. 1MA-6-2]